jgi:hypothetical protein
MRSKRFPLKDASGISVKVPSIRVPQNLLRQKYLNKYQEDTNNKSSTVYETRLRYLKNLRVSSRSFYKATSENNVSMSSKNKSGVNPD